MAQTNILLESGTNELEIVEFYIDHASKREDREYNRSYYGINVAKVVEIIRMPDLTDMPEATSESVLGAFDLRSEIIPLIDLSMRVNKKRLEREAPKVVVTEFNKIVTAFLVSGVTRIHRISWEDVEAPSQQVQSLTANSITGVVKIEGRIVFLLDLEKIVADLNPGMARDIQEAAGKSGKAKGKDYTALIADDSFMVRRMISHILEEAGFTVIRSVNGKKALEELLILKDKARQQERDIRELVDVVVSDIEMPVMDGHNLTKRIKDDPVLKRLPVLLFSSIITDNLRHKGEAVGADDQLSKAEIHVIVDRIMELLDRMADDPDHAE